MEFGGRMRGFERVSRVKGGCEGEGCGKWNLRAEGEVLRG